MDLINSDEVLYYSPPHSTEAEQAFLGCLLQNNEIWFDIEVEVKANDFYHKEHQTIFSAIFVLLQENKRIDWILLSEYLQGQETLERIGGQDYILKIIQNAPALVNAALYAEVIRKKSILRQLDIVGQKISRLARSNSTASAEDILDEAESLVFQIAEQTQGSRSAFIPINEVVDAVETQVQQNFAKNKDGITGLRTGFRVLDKKTAGLQNGDLIIIAGRPSMGKTSFAMNIAEYAALHSDKTVAVFSMEMLASQLGLRMIGSLGEIEISKLRIGQGLNDGDWSRFQETIEKLRASKLYIDESGGLTALEVKARIRRLKREHPDLGLVVIDYIQLMNGLKGGENRNAELAEISRALKSLAREISAPVIVLSQLSRRVEERQDKRPMLSDLRDSGAIEQDADLIIFMYRASYYRKDKADPNTIEDNTAEAIIGKHRNGPTGILELQFKNEYTRFYSVDTVHIDEF